MNDDWFTGGRNSWFTQSSSGGIDKFKQRKLEEAEQRALLQEFERSQEQAQANQEDDGGFLSGTVDVLQGLGEAFSKNYERAGRGWGETLHDWTGGAEDTQDYIGESQDRMQEQLISALKNAKDESLTPEKRDSWALIAENITKDMQSTDRSNREMLDERIEWTDPKKGAAAIGGVGVDVLSGGQLTGVRNAKNIYKATQGARGVRTGRLGRSADLGGYGTVKEGALRGGGEALALGAGESAARQYVTEGEIDPRDFLVDSVASAAFGGTLGGVAGGMSARQTGRAARANLDEVGDSASKYADEMDAEDLFKKAREAEPSNNTQLALDTGETRIKRRLEEIDMEIERLQNGEMPVSSYQTGASSETPVGISTPFSNKVGDRQIDRILEGKDTLASGENISDYYRRAKGEDWSVVEMTPDEYLRRDYEMHKNHYGGNDTFEEWLEKIAISDKNVNKIAEDMQRGVKYDMPYINERSVGQEGRHRMMAAKKLGYERMPVALGKKFDAKAEAKIMRKSELSTPDARRSPEVTPELFRGHYNAGEKKIKKLKKASSEPKALNSKKKWDSIVDDSYNQSREEWGGVTVNARTGEAVAGDADAYALTIRDPGMDTVAVSPKASKAEFKKAMNEAKEKYKEILSRKDSHLGVFHDADTGMVEIDPVLITTKLEDVHDIGAYTKATGGAYHFKSGDGFWPPHVPDDVPTTGGTSKTVGTMTGEGAEEVVDSKRVREEWQKLQQEKETLKSELIRAEAPSQGQYTAEIGSATMNKPGGAVKKAAKAAEKRIEAIPNTGYKGAASDTITSFMKSLQGGIMKNKGYGFVNDTYKKVVGGLSLRNENRRLMAKVYNETVQKSNAWKRKNGAAVGDALRNVSDEDMASLTVGEISRKYRMNSEVVEVAKKTRRHFQEMLDQVNEARILRGQEPIPYRSEYMPQWGKKGKSVTNENKFLSDSVDDYNAKFSKERTGAIRDYERNVFKVMDEYHSQVANEIHLTPIIRHLDELAEGISKPIRDSKGRIMAPGNEEGAAWIKNYINEGLLNRRTRIDEGVFEHLGGDRGWAARMTDRLIIARSLSGLAGNIRWMIFTQPQTLAVSAGQHGWKNTFMGVMDSAFDPKIRREIQDLEIYKMKRSQSVGATAGGMLDRLDSSVLKTRREFANDLMTTPSNYVEAALDTISAAAARRQAQQLGLNPAQTRNMMNNGIEVTQSVYSAEMRAKLLRSSFIRASFPFQTYSTEMWRHMRNLTRGPASGLAYEGERAITRRLMTATSMISAIALGNYLQKQVTGSDIASPGSVVPLVGSQVDASLDWVTSEFDFLPDTDFSYDESPPITAFEADFAGLFDAVKGYIGSDSEGDIDKLRKEVVRWGMGLSGVGGAATVNRWVDSYIAFEQGYIESGDKQIPLETSPGNIARGFTGGVWSTPEGQAHIEGDRWELGADQYENVMGEDGEAFEALYSEMRNLNTEKRRANEEISKVANEGNINKARRLAMEFNAQVDERLQPVIDMFGLNQELYDAINEYKVGEEIHHIKRRVD